MAMICCQKTNLHRDCVTYQKAMICGQNGLFVNILQLWKQDVNFLATRCLAGWLAETLFSQEIFIISFGILKLNIQSWKQILKECFAWKFIVWKV